MVLRFFSGSDSPSSAEMKRVAGVDVDERDVVVAAEELDDLARLVQAHQAVIDEDAGELVADRLVDQHGGDGGVDAARQAADDPAVADLLADAGDRLVAEGRHGPVAGTAGDAGGRSSASSLRAVRRVDDLRGGTGWRRSGASRRRSWRRARLRRSPTTSKPSGSAVTRSPWLIHTWWRSPGCQTPSSQGRGLRISTKARPNSRLCSPSTLPPSWCAIACSP